MGERERFRLPTSEELLADTDDLRRKICDLLEADNAHPAIACLAMALLQAAVLDGAVPTFRDPRSLATLREGIEVTLGDRGKRRG